MAADDMIIMGLQASTQWDGLAHVGYKGFFYNGVPQGMVNNFMGAMKNDIAKVAPKLISRGVLLDIAALKGVEALPDSYEITEADVLAAEERQGVRVESGRHPVHPHRLVQVLRRGRPAALRGQHGRPRPGHLPLDPRPGDRGAGPRPGQRRVLADPDPRRHHPVPPGGDPRHRPDPGRDVQLQRPGRRLRGRTACGSSSSPPPASRSPARWARRSPRSPSSRRGRADDQLRGRIRGRLHHRRRALAAPGRGQHRRHHGALHAGRGPRGPRDGRLRGRGRDPGRLGRVEAQGAAAPHAGQHRRSPTGTTRRPARPPTWCSSPRATPAGRSRSSPATTTCSARSTAGGCSAAGRTSTSAGSRRADPRPEGDPVTMTGGPGPTPDRVPRA